MRRPLLYCSKPAPFSTSQIAAGAMPRAANGAPGSPGTGGAVAIVGGGGGTSIAAITGGPSGRAARQPTPAAARATTTAATATSARLAASPRAARGTGSATPNGLVVRRCCTPSRLSQRYRRTRTGAQGTRRTHPSTACCRASEVRMKRSFATGSWISRLAFSTASTKSRGFGLGRMAAGR